MMTPGWFSILLTAMLAWSPPGESPEVKPVVLQAPGLPGRLASARRGRREQGRRHRFPGDRVPAGEPVCPAAGRAGACLREEGRRVLRRRFQPAGRPLGAVAVRQGARPAVPAAQGRGQRAGRPAGRRADARGLRPGRGPGRALSRPGGRPVRLRRAPAGADASRPRRGARRPARRPAGRHAADRARRLPDRPDREGQGAMRPSPTRSRWPASSATVASPATARGRSPRSR